MREGSAGNVLRFLDLARETVRMRNTDTLDGHERPPQPLVLCPENLEKIQLVAGNIHQGTLENFDASEGVAIGQRMADNLGLSLGDSITLISPDGDVTPLGTTPRSRAGRE